MSDTTRTGIFARINVERERQVAKWGHQSHLPVTWTAILSEEAGEVAKAALEVNHAEYVKELVQVAAVAVAALEAALSYDGMTRCGKPGCPCCAQLCPDELPEVKP